MANEKTLDVRRQLPPGVSQSRSTITDDTGKTILVRDAFPQLTRLGPPTGTQVIFAAQHAAGRRQAEISDFSKVLYFYLEIEEIPDFLDKLRKIAEERRTQQEEMSKSLDTFLQELRTRLSSLQDLKNEIVRSSPWGEGPTPTRVETDNKVDNLVHEIACLAEVEIPVGLSSYEKLNKVKEWNDALVSKKKEHLEVRLNNLQNKCSKAQEIGNEWHATIEQIETEKIQINELKHKELELLGDQSLEKLEECLAAAEQEYDEAMLRSRILSETASYLSKYRPSKCLICDGPLPDKLTNLNNGTSTTEEHSSHCEELRKQISEINQAREEQERCRQSLAALQSKMESLGRDAESITEKSNTTLAALDQILLDLNNAISSMRNQIQDAQAEHSRQNKRVIEMEGEERYHYHQEQIAAIETILEADVEGSRGVLAKYDEFLSTAENVGKVVLDAFEKQIESAIPPLNDALTKIFTRLTAHPSYDGVTIVKQPLTFNKLDPGRLDLQVTSSRCQGTSFSVNVLNGQAARALHLVPYFVFSDYWKDIMELDLLLVDDPSESFDTSHLEHLMEVLQSVAEHTQLVVASHESEKMLPLIKKYFPSEQRCIISVVDFDPLKGPTLEPQ